MSIIYNTQGKTLIKTNVRLNKDNRLELFYYDEYKSLVCFTYAEGHNEACLAYMYQCKPVDQDTAEAFISAYNMRYDDNILHVYSKRLSVN